MHKALNRLQAEIAGETINGASGHVYAGHPRIEHERPLALLAEVARWKAALANVG